MAPRISSPSASTPKKTEGASILEIDNDSAVRLLEELNIGSAMETWTQNLRKVIVSLVLMPLSQRVHNMNAILAANKLDAYDCSHNLVKLPPSLPQQIQQERVDIELFLAINDVPREYILSRLDALTDGDYLARFRWDGGALFKGKEWNPKDLITDSHIVMHFICRFFDDVLPPDPLNGKMSFSKRHFARAGEKGFEERLQGGVLIFQAKEHPPHYKVAWMGVIKEVFQGRNNMFHAVILFLFMVKTHLKGYLDSIDISNIISLTLTPPAIE